MATLDEVCDAVKRWVDGFDGKCLECMEGNQGVFVHLITEQMYSGLKGDGTYITPSYDDDPFFEEPGMWFHGSERYKAWKGEITPPVSSTLLGLPPRPYDVPNLFITGMFHESIKASRAGDVIRVYTSGFRDGPQIERKYGEEIFQLTDEAKEYFNIYALRPWLNDFMIKCGYR